MSIEVPHIGDTIVRRDAAVLLILEGRLSERLAQRVLDCDTVQAGGRPEFTLRCRAPQTERARPVVHQPRPPHAPSGREGRVESHGPNQLVSRDQAEKPPHIGLPPLG